MQINRVVILLLTVLVISGCNTLASAINAKGTGPYRVYERSYDKVWDTVGETVSTVGLDVVTADKDKGMLLAQRSASFFSYGENVAIFVEKIGRGRVRVEINSKKQMETNVFAPDWSDRLFSYLDVSL